VFHCVFPSWGKEKTLCYIGINTKSIHVVCLICNYELFCFIISTLQISSWYLLTLGPGRDPNIFRKFG
jgi:hypothetical protein